MGVATTRLRLATNIYLAALRDPFTVSRAVSAAALFTNNRVACGVSAGWLKEEFDLAKIDFRTRGRRLDEIITAVRLLNSGEPVTHQGEFFDFEGAVMSPVATQAVPFWVGGKSKAALRRAARNDGWLGVPLANAEMKSVIDQLFELRREMGKGGGFILAPAKPVMADTPLENAVAIVEAFASEE